MARRERILTRDSWLCQCEECRTTGRVLPAHEVDHITPRAEGGTDAIENLVVLCPNCHRRADKGALSRAHLLRLTSAARDGHRDQGAPKSEGEEGV